MTDQELVSTAYLIAKLAHAGQTDKAGRPYLGHPVAVAAQLPTAELKAIALLHDVLEDTEVTEGDLRPIFGDEIVDTLLLLTHKDGVPYMEYVRALGHNPLARQVKLADLTHNMDLSRFDHVTEKEIRRVEEKYKPAYAYLRSLEEEAQE